MTARMNEAVISVKINEQPYGEMKIGVTDITKFVIALGRCMSEHNEDPTGKLRKEVADG